MSAKRKWNQLREFAEQSRQTHNVPGLVVGLLHKGKIKTAGFGVTNLENPLEVNSETLFQIGSITKTFTGTLAMKLVENGKLDLDSTVRSYLPDFKVKDETASEKATIRHLMTHTSGWTGDFFQDTGPGDDAGAKYMAEMANLDQLAPFGKVWSYNNAGFYLLGHIIETITEKSFQQVLREEVLETLGLKNTFFDPGDVITYRFASGHNGPQVARPWPLPRAAYPAGGITCHVHDLLTYAQFHMGKDINLTDEPLLTQESRTLMQTPQTTVWKKEHWGLTWAVNETYETRLVSHSGGTTGQISQLTLAPDKKIAWAIFTNASSGGAACQEINKRILRDFVGIEVKDPQAKQASEKQLIPFVGKYSRPAMDIHLGLLGGKLIGKAIPKIGFPDQDSPPPPTPPPFTLDLIEEDRLMVLDGQTKGMTGDIIRKPDGSIGWLRVGRIHKKVG